MFDIKLNFENKKKLETSIDQLAKAIAYHGILKINDKTYQITDFEFYINSGTAETKDPHTYNHNLQKEYGKIYDHKSGLDLTFGDGRNAVGVLLRGIVELFTSYSEGKEDGQDISQNYFVKNHFASPHKVRTEIISNLKWGENNLSFDFINPDQGNYPNPNFKLLKTNRVNLTTKPDDPEHVYMDKPLRYVSMIPRYKKMDESEYILNGNPMKIPTIEKLLKLALNDQELKFTQEDIRLFIDYKLK